MKYSKMLKSNPKIIHVVGGAMNDDLAARIPEIADWFVKNGITLLWGDDYNERENPNHPVALLEKEITARGGKKPIRALVMGTEDFNVASATFEDRQNFEPVYDDSNTLIGYIDKNDKNYIAIYSAKQQNRQEAYYNNADALMVLNGGLGAAYEIPSAFLYTLSGDVKKNFKVIVIDNPENGKFGKLIDAYLACGGCIREMFPQLKVFENAEDFLQAAYTNADLSEK